MKLEKIEKCKLKILLTYKLCKNSIKKESILKSQKINIQNITDKITGIEFYKDVKLYERENNKKRREIFQSWKISEKLVSYNIKLKE